MAGLASRAESEADSIEDARMGDNDERAKAARLERQRALGDQLRETFEKVSEEAVPDRLRKLAEDLDRRLKDRARSSKNTSD